VNGTLQVRCSASLSLSRIIGGVVNLVNNADDKARQLRATNSDACRVSTLELATISPEETYAFYFNLEEDIPSDYVYFQFVLRYTDVQVCVGAWVHMVVMHSGYLMTRDCCDLNAGQYGDKGDDPSDAHHWKFRHVPPEHRFERDVGADDQTQCLDGHPLSDFRSLR